MYNFISSPSHKNQRPDDTKVAFTLSPTTILLTPLTMATTPKTRVLLIGSGGVGTMASYALEAGGKAEVTSVLRSNFAAVQEKGFSIDSLEHGHGITGFRPSHIVPSVPDVSHPDTEPFEYIIVATKNVPDVSPTVLDILRPAVTESTTTIVLLQNGLNIEKPLLAAFPHNVILSGVSMIGASEPTHGHIVHEDYDITKLGPFPDQQTPPERANAATEKLLALYNAGGKVTWQRDPDVAHTRWRKLVYNSSFNSVAAILKMGVIRMRASRHVADDLILPAMREIVAVAAAAGVRLEAGVEETMLRVDPVTADFMPSMGQDAAKGNYVEMETIVGEPVREAERLGVEVPTLKVIYGMLKGLQYQTKVAKGAVKVEFGEGNPYG